MIDDRLFKVMLNSFIPPIPPSIFPTSTLQEQHGVFVIEKVLKAVKSLPE